MKDANRKAMFAKLKRWKKVSPSEVKRMYGKKYPDLGDKYPLYRKRDKRFPTWKRESIGIVEHEPSGKLGRYGKYHKRFHIYHMRPYRMTSLIIGGKTLSESRRKVKELVKKKDKGIREIFNEEK